MCNSPVGSHLIDKGVSIYNEKVQSQFTMALRHPRLSNHTGLLIQANDKEDVGGQLSQELWNMAITQRNKAFQTVFVQGVGHGTLNPTKFGGYMVQDSVYLFKAKQSIDVALARVPSSQPLLKAYLKKESESYEAYYKELWGKWHIQNANGIDLSDACQSYANYEDQVASTMDPIYFIVSMIPCMKLWPWLGQQLQGQNHGVYKEWYDNNFDPTYDGYKKLDAFVDAAAKAGTIDKTLAATVYMRCMEGEYEFFNSADQMSLT